MPTKSRIKVARFWLQETASFPEGAPQRETYTDDEAFAADCLIYEHEWRSTYVCGDPACKNRDCPQHFPTQ